MGRSLLAFGTTLAAMGIAVAGANATGLNLTYVMLPRNMSVDDCKDFGRNALRRAGLTLLSNTAEAAWGEIQPNILASVYCIVDHGIAVVSVAGPNTNMTAPISNEIASYLQK